MAERLRALDLNSGFSGQQRVSLSPGCDACFLEQDTLILYVALLFRLGLVVHVKEHRTVIVEE